MQVGSHSASACSGHCVWPCPWSPPGWAAAKPQCLGTCKVVCGLQNSTGFSSLLAENGSCCVVKRNNWLHFLLLKVPPVLLVLHEDSIKDRTQGKLFVQPHSHESFPICFSLFLFPVENLFLYLKGVMIYLIQRTYFERSYFPTRNVSFSNLIFKLKCLRCLQVSESILQKFSSVKGSYNLAWSLIHTALSRRLD